MEDNKFYVILDLAATCNGKITKDLIKAVAAQARKFNMGIYAILVPAKQMPECCDWFGADSLYNSNEIIGCSIDTWEVKESLTPPILFDAEIDRPYVYALLAKDVTKYKDPNYPTWDDLKNDKWDEAIITVDVGFKKGE